MKLKIGIKDVMTIIIGTALFLALTTVNIPLVIIPKISLHPRMAVIAFFAAAFGPVVGGFIGFFGHALGDAMFNGNIYWDWVIGETLVGIVIGIYEKHYDLRAGSFNTMNIINFNMIQIIANAAAWLVVAPVLDIIRFREPVTHVIMQGLFAFLGNIIMVAVLGTIFIVAYSHFTEKSLEDSSD